MRGSEDIVQAILHDRERGTARLVAEYKGRLYAAALALCKDAAEAEDLVFRTIERTVAGIRTYRERDSFYEWMYVILLNQWRNSLRGKTMRNTFPAGGPQDLEAFTPAAGAEGVEAAVDGDIVRRELGKIPPSMREVLMLHYFMDMPVAQIARFLTLPMGTVKSRLHYARLALAYRLGAKMKKPAVALAVAALALVAGAVVVFTSMGGPRFVAAADVPNATADASGAPDTTADASAAASDTPAAAASADASDAAPAPTLETTTEEDSDMKSNNLKNRRGGGKILAVSAAVLTAAAVQGTDFNKTDNNGWMDGAVWTPVAGGDPVVATSSGDPANPNVYKQNGCRLNTPSGSTAMWTFPGDVLELNGGSQAVIFRSAEGGGLTVNDCRVTGNTTIYNWNTALNPEFAGNITVASGKTLTFHAGNGTGGTTQTKTRQFLITADMTGTGALTLNSSADATQYPPYPTFLYGDNSGLTGGVTFNAGFGRFCVTNENALGGGAVTFKGSTLLTQEDVRFTSAGRAVTLAASNDTAPTFEVAADSTNFFAWAIHGTSADANLIKGGAGTLVLAAASDYAGQTIVKEGTLYITREEYVSPNTQFVVHDGATLRIGNSYDALGVAADEYHAVDADGLKVGVLSVAGVGGFNVNLAGVAGGAQTALIRVTQELAISPFAVLVFRVSNVPDTDATPIRLFSAPSLAAFKDIDFFVDAPYAGTLSRTVENGQGVLWFTPTPKANIIFKTAADRQGTTNFYLDENTFWDGGAKAEAGNVYVSTNLWCMSHGAFPAPLVAYGPANFMPRGRDRVSSFPALTLLDGAALLTWDSGATLTGHALLAPVGSGASGCAAAIRQQRITDGGSNVFKVSAAFSGYGRFDWIDTSGERTSGDYSTFTDVTGDNAGFFGKVYIYNESSKTGHVLFRIDSEEALGGNPPAYRADQLVIGQYAALGVTKDVTLDDENRGIVVGRTIATGKREGTGCLHAAAGATFNVECAISDGNGLGIKGAGTVRLAAANAHAGGTTVYDTATLRLAHEKCLGGGLLSVQKGATVAVEYPNDMPNGTIIGGGGNRRLEFNSGSKLTVAFKDGYELKTATTIPLLTVPNPATTSDANKAKAAENEAKWYSSVDNFPFECKVPGWQWELSLENRVLSVTFRPRGFRIILR